MCHLHYACGQLPRLRLRQQPLFLRLLCLRVLPLQWSLLELQQFDRLLHGLPVGESVPHVRGWLLSRQ